MLLTHVIERFRVDLNSSIALSRDSNDTVSGDPLVSWLCFLLGWLCMQTGFSHEVTAWSSAAPGPYSTSFDSGR